MQKLTLILLLAACLGFAVYIQTNVPYVEIRQNNVLLAITDRSGLAKVDLQAPSKVVLSKPGYFPKELEITDLEGTYYVQMVPAAVIFVQSDQEDAKVFLNDELVGKTPIQIDVLPGVYTLRVEKEGFCVYQEKVAVEAFEKVQINVKFSKIPKVRIFSNPTAEAYVNGRRVGTTPVEIELEPGKHSLVLRRENYFDLVQTIEVSNIQNQTFAFNLQPCAYVKITTTPSHAFVVFEDQRKLQGSVFGPLDLNDKVFYVEALGYQRQAVEIEPKQGLNEIHVVLQPSVYDVEFVVSQNAIVTVDGMIVGEGPRKLRLSGEIHFVEIQQAGRRWAGIVNLSQQTVIEPDFEVATLILLGDKSRRYVVQNVEYRPPAVVYLKPGRYVVKVNDIERIVDLQAGTVTYLKQEGYGYLNVFHTLVVEVMLDLQLVGLTPVLFYPVKPGRYSLKVADKSVSVFVSEGEILVVR
ncbi:PEGA domain-containing protein [Pseudothermotoga thermarum]|uniref:PEGA domain protein n=1 Tax=Pseudothermotoga thermarum DSM 5069 TaxID=688269 RepID=F7YVT6_9THEM|nr:PEGA domain-containing protein [Pseudothermotoga thermarum]AEH51758.1 PEGA domain protein [Pseudothermotoga thermarum DSM 5069]